MTSIFRLKLIGILLPFTLLLGCARFNLPFSTSYRLLVTLSGSNSVRIYSANASTGALTFVSSLSITSPTKVVAHPTSGAFWIYKNNTSLECYQYNFRNGTGPTLGSSTTISGTIDQISAANDGSSIIYSKSGNANVFWRTVSDCSVGSENSVSAPGKVATVYFSENSSGSTVAVMEDSANRIWKFSRASDATLTLSGTYTGGTSSSAPSMTPDGNFLVFSKTNDVSVLNLSTMSIVQTVAAGASMNLFTTLSNTRALGLRVGVTHRPITISSGGTPSVGTDVDHGITDFNGGYAEHPSKTFFFTGDQADGSVWVHIVRDATPFVATPTETTVGGTPDALAVMPYYSRQ